MVWPEGGIPLHEIPHLVEDYSAGCIPEPAQDALIALIRRNHDKLEAITHGDRQQEEILGSLLIHLAESSANAATKVEAERNELRWEVEAEA